jgi:hypothetical protein
MLNNLRRDLQPEFETDLGNLTAKNILDKINSFRERNEKGLEELADGDFLELLKTYPVSMCQRSMTDKLELLIALHYFFCKPTPEEVKRAREQDKYIWEGHSFDYLSLIFDRSKSSIHEAISHKEHEAKAILEENILREKAKAIALEQLVAEEKERIKQNNEETNERTLERGI